MTTVSSQSAAAQRLAETGIGLFELSLESQQAVGCLHDVFQCVCVDELFDLPHNSVLVPHSGAAGDYTFVVTRSQSTQNMRWLWAGDSHTLDAFAKILSPELQTDLSPVVGGPVDLNAACYIIVRNGVTDQECVPHYDFYSPEFPRTSVFTLMTPMSPGHPVTVGGLEFWPWNGPDKSHKDTDYAFRYDVTNLLLSHMPYKHGAATIVDARLLHRTQPYRVPVGTKDSASELDSRHSFRERLDAAISSGALRALVCVNLSRTTNQSRPHLESLLLRQVGSGCVRFSASSALQQGGKQIVALQPSEKPGANPAPRGHFLLRKMLK